MCVKPQFKNAPGGMPAAWGCLRPRRRQPMAILPEKGKLTKNVNKDKQLKVIYALVVEDNSII